MLNKFIGLLNERTFDLYNNGKPLKIKVKRIKSLKDYIENLISVSSLKHNKAFFIYNKPNITTFGMSEKVDLLWVNWDGKVINIEENFDLNKVSKQYKDTKYIYIFSQNTISGNKIILNDVITHQYNRTKTKFYIRL